MTLFGHCSSYEVPVLLLKSTILPAQRAAAAPPRLAPRHRAAGLGRAQWAAAERGTAGGTVGLSIEDMGKYINIYIYIYIQYMLILLNIVNIC